MSDYIPTTEQVRDDFIGYGLDNHLMPDAMEFAAEFDRWLAQHDAEITAKAEQRIIKLLEDLDRHGTTHSEFCAARHAYAAQAIARIKGEESA